MGLQVGDNFSWFKPVNHEDSDTIGSYVGDYEALNIRGAQPDYHYYYQRFSKNRSDAVLRFRNKGWSVVGPDDPEKFGSDLIDWHTQVPLGTERAYGDVILMKIPLALYRKQQEERQAQVTETIQDFGARFTELGEERAANLKHRPQGQLYYARPDHGQTIEEL